MTVAFLSACGLTTGDTDHSPRPAHHTADGFRNLYIEDRDKNLLDFFAMKYFGDTEWADHAARAAEVPVRDVDPEAVGRPAEGLRISWLGHSTFLIQRGSLNILTDPVFGRRASSLSFAGPERYVRHVVDYERLPDIDYVVVSHNHYDHLDVTAVDLLGDGPLYLVPLGLKTRFTDRGIGTIRVREFDWWNRTAFADLTVQAMPSQHWSARGFFDRRETLWASWYLETGGSKIWFAGDTGYNAVQFKEIGQATGGVDVAFIPIGGYLPRSFMGPYHVDPREAVEIHGDVGAKLSIGMHWGTFPLTAEGPIDPVEALTAALAAGGIEDGRFITMAVGQTIVR